MRRSRRRADPTTRRLGRRNTHGFALIAALGILVVLASIGAVMIRLGGVQQAGVSTALLGQRARWAARSGIEWAVREAAGSGGCPAPTTTLGLGEGAVSGFTVVVRCSQTSHWEGGAEFRSLTLRSEASFGALGTRDFVYRELVATIVL